ncbi:MAG: sodium:solute symporter [Prevotellaceae bacterium]|nr:sodium:solute symporter [Prevotellaceae bacterium]MDY6200257.1 sodium:solute symporter [Prevotella sp.]
MTIIITLAAYFALLLIVSRITGRGADNKAFFRANRKSPWYMVAFGMIGASISGVTFVSVPGMVMVSDMTYLQTCMGFIVGYAIVAFVLLPVYYRMNLISIYEYLGSRFGRTTYLTGSWLFVISKLCGAAVSFYVVCMILQDYVVEAWGVPFPLTVVVMVALIWLYTRSGGIKTLVWTDSLQTICLFAALAMIIYNVADMLGMDMGQAVAAVADSSMSRIVEMDDWMSRQYFWKQFISGAFIVVVMTGLDQDKMQKNLTCRNLRDAQKDMCTYGLAFVPANLLFLMLGVMLVMLAQRQGGALPGGDQLLPMFAASGHLGQMVVVLFTVGMVAAAFSSADSALTSLTTTFCVDICQRTDSDRLRRMVHLVISMAFVAVILMFKWFNNTSVIDAIYIMVSYTYGPLLGLFAFGLTNKRKVRERWVPMVAVASPVLCYAFEHAALSLWGYQFGYELLLLNGLLTWLGMLILSINSVGRMP